MELDATQGAAVYALLEAIGKAAEYDTQDYEGIRRLTDAAKSIMTNLEVKDV